MLPHAAVRGLDELLHAGRPRGGHEVVRLAHLAGEVEVLPGPGGHLHGEDGPDAVHGRAEGRRFGEIADAQLGAECLDGPCARRVRVTHQRAHRCSLREQRAGGGAALAARGTGDEHR